MHPMTTKLVYVLTCASDKHYIEQALMSAFSARHWNPDANIVLMVDDKTDSLLQGKRAEILRYITEKIVVSFDDASLSPMYRSRFIKTSVRQRIKGDFLFIDSDTIISKSLSSIDCFECEVGAVLQSHLLVEDYCDSLRSSAIAANIQLGVDLDVEKEYFSSGVLYVKDVPIAHKLYERWHQFWQESYKLGLPIDHPSLAKANRESGHIIRRIPDTYNCILFTQNDFTDKSHILHIAAYRNPSFLFTDKVFKLLEREGLMEWIKDVILNPCCSMLPFDYSVLHSTIRQRLYWLSSISSTASTINRNLPELTGDFPMQSSLRGLVLWLFHLRCYRTGAISWMFWKRLQVLRKHGIKDNCCRK